MATDTATTGRWPAKARHWEFLRPHFGRLRGRLATHHDARFPYSHAVRVGVDPADWWISVSLEGLATPREWTALREALLVVGAFAQLQRDCCLQYLQTFSLWHRAPFVDLDDARFLPRFRVILSPMAGANDVLLGDGVDDGSYQGASAELVNDWARVLDMQDRVGGTPVELAPVELLLQVDVARVPADVEPVYFRCLRNAVQSVQATLRERRFVPQSERALLEPVFEVRAMDLALENAALSRPAMEELHGLVALGVPLNNVELPVVAAADLNDVNWRFAWCELLCTIMGVASSSSSSTQDASSPSVRRLIVPSHYVRGSLLSSLFSALVCARGVGELQIGQLVSGPEPPPLGLDRAGGTDASVLEVVDPNFWYWLASLLLPDDAPSSSSIETVSLFGARIPEASMSMLETVARSKPAIRHVERAYLAGLELAPALPGSQLRTVTIAGGTQLSLYEINGRKDLVTPKALTAKVVQDGHGSSPAVLIVPGLGVCSVDAAVLPADDALLTANKKTRKPNVGIKNLKFIAPPRGSQSLSLLKRLVRLVGPSLEGLHVSTQRMTDATVAKFVRLCPNLESLSVTGANITSLDFLWDAYARGCKISSLEFATNPLTPGAPDWNLGLRFGQLPPRESLDVPTIMSLVYQLMSHQTPVSRTLTRLSLVRHDFHHNHPPLLDDMLANNQSLTHFWFVGCRASDFSRQWIDERHHGRLLPNAPPISLSLQQRLAFLSVLRHRRHANAALQVDSFVGSLIFQFAATTQRRSVVRSLS